MIRSGSTLQYNIAKKLVEETSKGKGEGFFTFKKVEFCAGLFSGMEKDSLLHVIKMHEKYPFTSEKKQSDGIVKVVYICRDIRDVSVSVKRKFKYHDDKLIEVLDRAISTSKEILSTPNVLFQKYENIYVNLKVGIEEQAKFLGLNISESIANKVMLECSIDNALKNTKQFDACWRSRLKGGLRKLGLPIAAYDKNTLLHHDHISEHKGAIGDWKFCLSKSEQEFITRRYSDWLTEMGYFNEKVY